MDTQRWREIEQLYHAALERKPEERHAFVIEACDSNEDLIREVESLLAQDAGNDSLLESPAWEGTESLLEEPNIIKRLEPGALLGPYRIEALIGVGGMGQVYRAKDKRLGRHVAIKLLPAEFGADSERQRRLEREARAAGMVNHPNITAVYDIGTHEGLLYVVSELLEGETLRARLNGRALPQRTALRYALQIARGLDAAHQRGIVHRDLKPENVFITRDEVVKILDLGLAKLTREPVEESSLHTRPGLVLGTPAYMSPEQVRGETVDARSDIFAFGAILHEMLTGRSPFARETSTESMHAVLKDEPPELPAPALDRIVRHCLEKDARQRFQSVHDVVFALEAVSEIPSAGSVPLATPRHFAWKWRFLPWAIAIASVLAAVSIALVHFRDTPDSAHVIRFSILPPPNTSFPSSRMLMSYGMQALPLVSPDGRRIVFAAWAPHNEQLYKEWQLWTYDLGSGEYRLLPGTKNAIQFCWSPDSRSILLQSGGKLQRFDVESQSMASLAEGPIEGAIWNRDDTILFSSRAGIIALPSQGGKQRQVTAAKASEIQYPAKFLGDDRKFLFISFPSGAIGGEIWMGSLDGTPPRHLFSSSSQVASTPSGHVAFVRRDTLLAQSFDVKKEALLGTAQPVGSGLL